MPRTAEKPRAVSAASRAIVSTIVTEFANGTEAPNGAPVALATLGHPTWERSDIDSLWDDMIFYARLARYVDEQWQADIYTEALNDTIDHLLTGVAS